MRLAPLKHLRGYMAEMLAILYLTLKLYKIKKWRYRNKFGEIDIIAQKGRTIIFIEVKYRRYNMQDWPALSDYQLQRIINSAGIYLQNAGLNGKLDQRFDLLLIKPWKLKPIHYQNITL